MRKLHKLSTYFLLAFVTVCFISSCGAKKTQLSRVKAKNIEITNALAGASEVDAFVKPYREHVQKEMDVVLAYNPVELPKDRNEPSLNAAIGNFMADATYEIINPVYSKNTGKNIDFVLLNWGGIRTSLPKGNLTVGSAYEVMPFENKIVVLTMKGEKVKELAQYLIDKRVPHPLSKQVHLQITKDGQITEFTIGGKPFDPNATYIVATSDYLMNGGDAMYFFKGAEAFETGYLARNVLIDYFKKVGTLEAKKDNRFEYKP